MTVAILFIVFFALLIIGVPVAISLGISSVLVLFIADVPLLITAQKIYEGINNFPLMAIPLFILAGTLMSKAGISDKMIAVFNMAVGRFTGGLANVATGTSAFFGSVSGSAPATTAAVGTIMIPSMARNGYDRAHAGALVASAGVLGLILPPSITMIVYGVTAGVSISSLFLAGIVPGVIIAVGIAVLNYAMAKKQGIKAADPTAVQFSWKVLIDAVPALLMPVVILGGIYSGIFTPTESAAVACLYAFLVGLVIYRSLSFRNIWESLVITARQSAMILFIVGTATLFGFIITRENVPASLAQLFEPVADNRIAIMFIMAAIFIVFGLFLDNVSAIVLLTPTLLATVQTAEIDPLYFGIFMVIALAIGNFTPPVGLNLLIAAEVADVSFERMVRRVVPYVALFVGLLVVFIFAPGLLTVFTS